MVEVQDDHKGVHYCSFECACYDGGYSVRTGWKIDPANPPERGEDGKFVL
jgi:hypothetical protein